MSPAMSSVRSPGSSSFSIVKGSEGGCAALSAPSSPSVTATLGGELHRSAAPVTSDVTDGVTDDVTAAAPCGELYGSGCDVWSTGVTAFVMLTAALPIEFPEDSSEEDILAMVRVDTC